MFYTLMRISALAVAIAMYIAVLLLDMDLDIANFGLLTAILMYLTISEKRIND